MIIGGYILQPRKLDESEVSKMPPVTRELWLYLLRKVNHKDKGKLKRGQGFFSFNNIQNDLCWYAGYRKMVYSKPQLTKSLRRLYEGKMVETTKATRGLIITVCNYDYYQTPENYEGNDEESTKEPRKKSSGRTKNKNDKNVIIEEKKNIEKIVSFYHEKCHNLPKVLKITDDRIANINARIKEYSEEDVFKVIEIAATSKFLNGDNEKGWRASFDWLITKNPFLKVLEGKYTNATKINQLKDTRSEEEIKKSKQRSLGFNGEIIVR